MEQDAISVTDVGKLLGRRKQTIFKVLARLKIAGTMRRDPESGNQVAKYITQDEFERVRDALEGPVTSGNGSRAEEQSEDGWFYLVQLEPDHDSGRFKVGFATSMSERLRALRCSAPFARLVEKWPSRRLWERTAIDCVTAGCEQLHTEVFRAGESLERVAESCRRFFAMMPAVGKSRKVGAEI